MAMLSLRLARSPLPRAENETVLREYNRLTSARIPIEEFEHWVQKGPAGPAWHALLETDEGRIVGHTCLFPFRTSYRDANLIPTKSEYSVLHEDFRKMKIRGFEKAAKPAFIILLNQLFQHCLAQGWGPLFASTNEKNQVFTRKVGLRPLEFPLQECLLVLRPSKAARETPNIGSKERAALFVAGLGQRLGWSAALALMPNSNDVHSVPVGSSVLDQTADRLSFFEDRESLGWRYPDEQYVRFVSSNSPAEYVIAKLGCADRYLRVCQWRLVEPRLARSFVRTMVRRAESDGAIGVRWAIYENGAASAELVRELKKLGFLCAPRVRIVMVHHGAPQFQTTDAWTMNDSLFSFDP
jgi:hypothetical protein